MADLKLLSRKRANVNQKLSNMRTFVDQMITNSDSIADLEVRMPRLEQILAEFEEIQSEIELTVKDEELETEYTLRQAFENLYFDALTKAKSLLSNNDNVSQISCSSSHHGSHSDNSNSNKSKSIRLPSIDLPKYNGKQDNWLQFRDSFTSLIHLNNDISAIQKYHYLRSCLSDAALDGIRSIEFSATGYEVAWSRLCSRYNNSQSLIRTHIKAILSLPTLSKENARDTRQFVDALNNHLLALKSLNQPVGDWDTILIVCVTEKLDKSTLKEWETKVSRDFDKSSESKPTIHDLIELLQSKSRLLEQLEDRKEISGDLKRSYVKQNDKRCNVLLSRSDENTDQHSLTSTSAMSCYNCKGNHAIFYCKEFLNLKPEKRIDRIKELKLCMNCFKSNHKSMFCKARRCKECKRKHNSLLHVEEPALSSKDQAEPAIAAENAETKSIVSHSLNASGLLSTGLVKVKGKNGKVVVCRALLDSGSQSDFVSSQLAEDLELDLNRTEVSLIGINSTTTQVNSYCNITINSRHTSFFTELTCLVLPSITTKIPAISFNNNSLKIPKNIALADPNFNRSDRVDLLIGASTFWDVLLPGKIQLGKGMPTLQNTTFGWIISGSIPMNCDKVSCNLTIGDLNDQLKSFWQLEEGSYENDQTIKDSDCDEYFQRTFSRNSDGRFIVKIPFNENIQLLGHTDEIAQQRLFSLEKRFERDHAFESLYKTFMKEYIDLNHMTLVENVDKDDQSLLPHHGVLRSDSTSTRLRVVFDGSVESSSGISLNNTQLVGPTIQNDLMSIIIRFRQHQYVVCADIKQMYRQVLIHPDHRKYQRILWRNSSSKPIATYELNTVTYGTASAPYLAIKCLFQLASEFHTSLPQACDVIRNDFYVDDLITGDDDPERLITICKEIIEILNSGRFELRKFVSNDMSIANSIARSCNNNCDTLIMGSQNLTKTLGIGWSVQRNQLVYNTSTELQRNKMITKRIILASIAKIFDPLGLLSPIIVKIKIIMQELWAAKLQWDERVSVSIEEKWLAVVSELDTISKITFDRCVIQNKATDVQLHGFCDASKLAYGCCIYARSVNLNGEVCVRIVCAKSRVAPIKSCTIPRLELCAAVMLAELMHKVQTSLTIKCTALYWSDSQVAIHWINNHFKKFNVFVANRIEKIQTLTDPHDWHYVKTRDNPSDIISRGATPSQLLKYKMWWSGPTWLSEKGQLFVRDSLLPPLNEIPEIRKAAISFLAARPIVEFPFNRFSNLHKLIRTIAYIMRFKVNCLSKKKILGPISTDEYSHALTVIVTIVQSQYFHDDIKSLECNGCVDKSSKLVGLAPILDSNHILRVGGRLTYSHYNYNKKHQILLPKEHHLSYLIMLNEHIKLFHAGPNHTLHSSREMYWIMSGKNLAKKIVNSCKVCFKFKASECRPIMANLPKSRVEQNFPFNVTGVDYAGPFLINNKRGRGAKKIKVYVCLFLCLTTKCIHLEVVSDLSTEQFIATLRRFVARRGLPAHIYSDNGRNFVGANKELKNLYKFINDNSKNIVETSVSMGIQWHFMPPYAPHFGGIWEAGVRSMKAHLYRVLNHTSLVYDEFETIIVQIEGILNSRPLCQSSSNPNDLTALTPSHFMIGRSLTSIADPNVTERRIGSLSRFQYIQRIQQEYWHRWQLEYINGLQVRSKWRTSSNNIEVDTLVLVKENGAPPMRWKLGRVVQVHPGSDGVVRVISVRTASGIIKRAVTLVCPLPMD